MYNDDFIGMTMPKTPPELKLFSWNREENAAFEAHDQSMMRDPVSGHYYAYATDTAITSTYKQGIHIRQSEDL